MKTKKARRCEPNNKLLTTKTKKPYYETKFQFQFLTECLRNAYVLTFSEGHL